LTEIKNEKISFEIFDRSNSAEISNGIL